MLDLCKCKKGFFVLTDCKNAASTQCNACGRPACDDHLAQESGGLTCVECFQKQGGATNLPSTAAGGGYGRRWVYSYRNRYYDTYDYYPNYWGRDRYYFNDYDRQQFSSSQPNDNWTGSAGTIDETGGQSDFDEAGGDWFDS